MTLPKVAGGQATRDQFLPFSAPWLDEEEIEAVTVGIAFRLAYNQPQDSGI